MGRSLTQDANALFVEVDASRAEAAEPRRIAASPVPSCRGVLIVRLREITTPSRRRQRGGTSSPQANGTASDANGGTFDHVEEDDDEERNHKEEAEQEEEDDDDDGAGSQFGARGTPTFVELRVGQMAVRSHALPSDVEAGRRCQTFALPIASSSLLPPLLEEGSRGSGNEPLPLCATLCEADGDGGGRPIALSIVQPEILELPPHEAVELTATLIAPPLEALPYCLPLGHGGKRAADAKAQWSEAAKRAAAASPDNNNSNSNKNDDGGRNGGKDGGGGVCQMRLSVQWRPTSGEAGAATLYDPLGFPLDGDGEAHSPRRADRPPPLASVSSSLEAMRRARGGAGGWWEHDSLNLCRWNAAICSCGSLAELPISRVRFLIAAGIPMQHRMHVWEWCADALPLRAMYAPEDGHGSTNASAYATDGGGGGLDAAEEEAFEASAKVIEMDLLRTFPSHPLLATKSSALVAPLRRLLRAFARFSREVSYCQSLNFIGAVLLLHGDEEGAFALLACLCDALMPGFHRPTMDGLHIAQAALLDVLKSQLTAVHTRLTKEGVPILEQTTSWLLCAFIDALPLEATLRVWDLLFLDGQSALVRAGAAAFALHEDFLLTSNDVFNLKSVLMCDAGELASASLAPALRKAVDVALADAVSAAGLDEPLLIRRSSSVRSNLGGSASRDSTANEVAAELDGEEDYQDAAAEWMEDY